MGKAPEDSEATRRYTTAEQIAEDLRPFAADRPILARRISRAERSWRWCKRNRRHSLSLILGLGIEGEYPTLAAGIVIGSI